MEILAAVVVVLLLTGLSTLVWTAAGAARAIAARRRSPHAGSPSRYGPHDVAVLIAAHNEQLVIADTIRAVARQVPLDQIFVVSDGSRDRTAAVAEACGAAVTELHPNRGKAGAIRAGLTIFAIIERFPVVLLLDADTRLRDDYLASGLPEFDAPDVVAVAGRATTQARERLGWRGRILTGYRERMYLCTQYLQKYGQAARAANAVAIVPGMASMYRTDIIDDIEIDAPGLAIEDFNMTFEVHAKRLGRIAFHPARAVAETQDPATLGEYARQVKRWSLGFWQTVGRHGFRPGVFWASLLLLVCENIIASVVLVLLPAATAASLAAGMLSDDGGEVGAAAQEWALVLPPAWLPVVGWLAADLLLTLVAAVLARRWPTWAALAFPVLRILDATLSLVALVSAFGARSDGRWRSPARRSPAANPVVPALEAV